MTTFVLVDYPKTHPGVQRAERLAHKLTGFAQRLNEERMLATLLKWSLVATAVVVANDLIESWSDDHALAAWMAMWLVAFAGVAFFARPMQTLQIKQRWNNFLANRRAAESDRRLWAVAQMDPRIMAELQGAIARGRG